MIKLLVVKHDGTQLETSVEQWGATEAQNLNAEIQNVLVTHLVIGDVVIHKGNFSHIQKVL